MMPLHAAALDEDRTDLADEGGTDHPDWNSQHSPPVSAQPTQRLLTAVLYWINPKLGFGFAVTADGRDLLLSVKIAVRSLGRMPEVGSVLECQVEETLGKIRVRSCRETAGPAGLPCVEPGQVRSFDPRRGFGFLQLADRSELFVGSQEMRRMGVRPPLRAGQVLTLVVDRSRPEARIIRMVFASSRPIGQRPALASPL